MYMDILRLPEQNSVQLTGRLTRDAELRYTPKGHPVCSFDIAVNRRYKDSSTNDWKDETSFITIVTWGPSAERSNERGKKGTAVHISGRLKSRSWETKDGQKRSTLEVVANRVQFLSKIQGTAGKQEEVSEGAEVSEGSEAPATTNAEEVPF